MSADGSCSFLEGNPLADRLQLLRMLDVYAANWALLLEARNLKLVPLVREDFEAIHGLQQAVLPHVDGVMTDLLLAHEALADAIASGAADHALETLKGAHEGALAALRSRAA
jgi:hypothetical protein